MPEARHRHRSLRTAVSVVAGRALILLFAVLFLCAPVRAGFSTPLYPGTDHPAQDDVAQLGFLHHWLADLRSSANTAYVEQAYPLAGRLWMSMAELGDHEAAFRLGMLYDTGSDWEQNAERAVFWYRYAAQAGHVHAQHNLAVALARGEGVAVDMVQAMTWWLRAARRGNPDSQYNLGIIYATGAQGVARDIGLAEYWWRRAALNGDAQAQYNLGALYANATGQVRNYCEATRWWEASASNGIAQASRALEMIRQRPDYEACW